MENLRLFSRGGKGATYLLFIVWILALRHYCRVQAVACDGASPGLGCNNVTNVANCE